MADRGFHAGRFLARIFSSVLLLFHSVQFADLWYKLRLPDSAESSIFATMLSEEGSALALSFSEKDSL